MPRRWRLTALVMAAGLAMTSVPTADAAVKVGSACPKVGKATKVGSSAYVCKKVGSRLIWQKVAVKSAPAAPSASPTAIAEPKPTPRPIDVLLLPQSPSEGTRCSINATATRGEIAADQFSAIGPIRCTAGYWRIVAATDDSVMTRAFRYVWQRWLAVKDDPVTSEIHVAPTAGEWGEWATKGYLAGARFWRATEGKMLVRAIVSDDGRWLELKANALGWGIGEYLRGDLDRGAPFSFALNAPLAADGYTRLPWIHMLNQGSPNRGIATGASHEFGHVAQIYLSKEKIGRVAGSRAPWLVEGQPSYFGAALAPLIGMRYDTREDWLGAIRSLPISLVDVSDTTKAPGGSAAFQRAYGVGFFATEALTAIYGADVTDNLYRATADGRSMDASFREVLGVDIVTASATLDGYIDSITMARPWTLSELRQKLAAAGFRSGSP